MAERTWILAGDLGHLEFGIADYIAKWGEHFTGRPYIDAETGFTNIAGIPTGTANMAMTVIRKNVEPHPHVMVCWACRSSWVDPDQPICSCEGEPWELVWPQECNTACPHQGVTNVLREHS